MIERFSRLRLAPRQLSQGERAALFGAIFFATIAVAMWAATLRDAGFFVGMAWMLVLLELDKWARPVGG